MMTQMDHFREYELRRKDWSQDADPCEHNCGYIRPAQEHTPLELPAGYVRGRAVESNRCAMGDPATDRVPRVVGRLLCQPRSLLQLGLGHGLRDRDCHVIRRARLCCAP
jgi:hypothetical protein